MQDFVPDISRLWFGSDDAVADRFVTEGGDDLASVAQREALEELNERIQAARCVY